MHSNLKERELVKVVSQFSIFISKISYILGSWESYVRERLHKLSEVLTVRASIPVLVQCVTGIENCTLPV